MGLLDEAADFGEGGGHALLPLATLLLDWLRCNCRAGLAVCGLVIAGILHGWLCGRVSQTSVGMGLLTACCCWTPGQSSGCWWGRATSAEVNMPTSPSEGCNWAAGPCIVQGCCCWPNTAACAVVSVLHAACPAACCLACSCSLDDSACIAEPSTASRSLATPVVPVVCELVQPACTVAAFGAPATQLLGCVRCCAFSVASAVAILHAAATNAAARAGNIASAQRAS